ncbi:hypothetical protein N656DRAFT_448543 [Canariomyces notabilis]|uniref:Ankyrin repeat protein n=1 Tax=Canariomyces notabilis TaxID=2074819 RepID=A0AAN6T8J3_9PEZI|nr:hypothetical protein N656DRAFT_448543 [Canariomyces arenarius]
MPIYEAQKRSHRLLRILARFSSSKKLVNTLDNLAKPLDPWGDTTLMRKLQMTSKHIVLCRALVQPPRQLIGWMKLLRNPVWDDDVHFTSGDVFGWVPLHYASLLGDFLSWYESAIFWKICTKTREKRPVFALLDRLGRSPLHILAETGKRQQLQVVLPNGRYQRSHAIGRVSYDQMTLLHLASCSGNADCVELLADSMELEARRSVDLWGRSALHLATKSSKNPDVARILLRYGFLDKIHKADKFAMTPFAYLLMQTEETVTKWLFASDSRIQRSQRRSYWPRLTLSADRLFISPHHHEAFSLWDWCLRS